MNPVRSRGHDKKLYRVLNKQGSKIYKINLLHVAVIATCF